MTLNIEKYERLMAQLHVLVVDDMDSIRTVVKSTLSEMGVGQVYAEPNGELAWKKLKEQRIDLLISDIDMPKVDGIELLQRIRFSEEHKHITVIMLTAVVTKEEVQKCIKAGANDYVAKPFQPKDLEYRVIKLLPRILVNMQD